MGALMNPPKSSSLAVHFAELKRGADALFGPGAARDVGRVLLLVFGGATTLLAVGTASADWMVKDQTAINVLENIRDAVGTKNENVNKNLDEIHKQQRVQGTVYNPEKDEETKTKRADAPDHGDQASVGQRRCGGKLSAEQKNVCEAIVTLEQERYRFLQDMRKLSITREKELRSIYEERNGIGEWEHGKLDSNTNRLLALMAHQRLDQMNLEMGLATFDERLRARRDEQTSLAQGLMDPSKKSGGPGGGGGGGGDAGTGVGAAIGQQAILAAALQVARQRER